MIALDLSPLVYAPHRGVARALLYLLKGLERIPRGETPVWGFLPTGARLAGEFVAPRAVDRIQVVGPLFPTPRQYRRALAFAMLDREAKVLLSPWAAFHKTGVPVVAWIHEVPFARHGALEGTVRTLRHRRALARAVERAAALVVPSRSVREDLLLLHPEAEKRVHVVPHGFEAQPSPAASGERVAATFFDGARTLTAEIESEVVDLRQPEGAYALLVGTGRGAAGPWKKGVDVFLAAYADERLSDLTPVLVGSIPYKAAGVVVFHEPSDAELQELIRRARVLVVPSRSEGFGYPMLEGFAAGVPVVASAAGALPEVSGGAARLVPPGDVDALAEALHRVNSDEDLRARHIQAGHRRALEFPVEAMAKGWLRVLTKAGGIPWHD